MDLTITPKFSSVGGGVFILKKIPKKVNDQSIKELLKGKDFVRIGLITQYFKIIYNIIMIFQ